MRNKFRRGFYRLEQTVLQRPVRERGMVLAVGAVLLFFPLWFWWIDPMQVKVATLHKQIEQQHQLRLDNQNALMILEAKLKQDPDRAIQDAIVLARRQQQSLAAQINTYTKALIPADQMALVLQSLLAQSHALRLDVLASLPPEPVLPDDPALNLYRHGVRIKLSGDYQAVYDYLVQVESLPQHFFWDSVKYSVEKHPQGTVEVVLYTLSDSKEFIRG